MVVGQPSDVMVQCMQRRGRQHARLAHAAAEHLAPAVRARDQLARADERRADRRAQALREAHRHAVEMLCDVARRDVELDRRVEEPRAVEMGCQTAAARKRRRVGHVRKRQRFAAERVFEREQARARKVRVVGLDGSSDVGERQRAVGLMLDRLRLHARQHRGAARFPSIVVRHLADDDLVAALAMAHRCDEVALRAAGHEQRRLLAEHRCDALLQRVDGRVVAEDVVTELGAHHRVAHRGGWSRDGVAAQIDNLHGLRSRKFFSIACPCSLRMDSG